MKIIGRDNIQNLRLKSCAVLRLNSNFLDCIPDEKIVEFYQSLCDLIEETQYYE